MKLTQKEKDYLIILIEVEKDSINFLRGFRKPNDDEQKQSAKYNKLIDKIKQL